MARFLDLPDELLLEIILNIALSSILSFSLINKHIYELCESVILKSQALHRKWGRVCLGHYWDTDLITFLEVLFRDPSIVWYIRELDTTSVESDKSVSNVFGMDADDRHWEVSMPRLKSQILSSENLDVVSRHAWLDALAHAGEPRSFLQPNLLLSVLPEVHKLIMPKQGKSFIASLQTSQLGSKLSKLQFDMSNRDTAVNDVVQCLQLPSLKELIAPGTKTSELTPFSTTLPVNVCPLIKLVLNLSAISPGDLDDILQRIKRVGLHGGLKTFIYSHQELAAWSAYRIFDGPGLIKILLTYSRQSLIELELDVTTSHYRHHHTLNTTSHIRIEKGLPALGRGLKEFERLEVLKVSIEMLIEDWWISDEESDDGNGAQSGDQGINMAAQLPLCEVLPMSLEVLHICSKGYMKSTPVMTEKLVTLFKKGPGVVPRLRELQLDWQLFDPWKGLLESSCGKRGMRLNISGDRYW